MTIMQRLVRDGSEWKIVGSVEEGKDSDYNYLFEQIKNWVTGDGVTIQSMCPILENRPDEVVKCFKDNFNVYEPDIWCVKIAEEWYLTPFDPMYYNIYFLMKNPVGFASHIKARTDEWRDESVALCDDGTLRRIKRKWVMGHRS